MRGIDLFAGLGGFSEGAEQAGHQIVWAANHWQVAVDYHELNHPKTEHKCQDLQQANFYEVPEHDFILASPCCQGHSPARGKATNNSAHDASRATAWAVVSAAEASRKPFIVENVDHFLAWELYPAWEMAMKRMGYSLSHMVVNASKVGVSQDRERLFIFGTQSKHPIKIKLPEFQERAVLEDLDFGSGNWSKIDKPGRSLATLKRVANGRRQFGDRFVMPYYKSGSGTTGRSLHRPVGTITTRARWALVDGDRMRMFTVPEQRKIMGFPDHYKLPKTGKTAIHLLGNAVCPPVARELVKAFLTVH